MKYIEGMSDSKTTETVDTLVDLAQITKDDPASFVSDLTVPASCFSLIIYRAMLP